MVDFGTDSSVFPAFDDTFTQHTDSSVLVQDLYKTVTTPQGALFWAPTKTLDLREELNSSASAQDRAALAARIEALFDDDPRIADITATLTHAGLALRVDLSGTATTGQAFRLVLVADSNQITVEAA